ncbi:glycine zipper domain-containing protein [Roseixanthobacter glucoisosaccharinicivorans]|uniref:glycine zipper domain-containing protein n=1 Tax=Roseixanthobacter glucoisosaccharinicivorans TaxID=3119923 RepID=UPI003727157A
MKKTLYVISLAALLAGSSAYAGEEGVAAGAVAGGTAGAVVGGPVGAAVGAGAGAVAGGAASNHDRDRVIIERHDADTTGSINCSSKTVHRENSMGDSTTVRRESCN